jgi:hypothetical protein
MSRRRRNGREGFSDACEIGLAMSGAPFRAAFMFMPMTGMMLRQAAAMRHAMYVKAKYGGTATEAEEMERHRRYVRAFYGW